MKLFRLISPSCVAGSEFGYSVAVSGKFALVGAPGISNQAGSAYVVRVPGAVSAVSQVALDRERPHSAAGDEYGIAVAVTDKNAVVGASGANNQAGRAYFYRRSMLLFSYQAAIPDPAARPGDQFGAAAAISGTTVVVGAPGTHDRAGAAYVFTLSNKTWRRVATLFRPRPAVGDSFGSSVAASGSIAVVGADGRRHHSGLAYVYRRSGSSWRLAAELTDPIRAANAEFGESVAVWSALSAARILIGAPLWRGCGAAFDFVLRHGKWRYREKLSDAGCVRRDEFGYSVAISGADAVIGAPGAKERAGTVYGQVVR